MNLEVKVPQKNYRRRIEIVNKEEEKRNESLSTGDLFHHKTFFLYKY